MWSACTSRGVGLRQRDDAVNCCDVRGDGDDGVRDGGQLQRPWRQEDGEPRG